MAFESSDQPTRATKIVIAGGFGVGKTTMVASVSEMRGAIGAVVLADTRRLDSCFGAVDFFERRGLPFVVGVNCFDNSYRYGTEEVRGALDLDDHTPVLLCDARERESTKQVLVALLQHAMAEARLTGTPS